MLVHVTARLCLLRLMHVCMDIALHRPVAARRVGIETTARAHRHVGRLVHRLDGAIAGRLHDDSPLATDPGDHCWPVLVIMAPAGLTLLAPATRPVSQRLLPAVLGVALLAAVC